MEKNIYTVFASLALGVMLMVAVYVTVLVPRLQDKGRMFACRENMRLMGIGFKMFAAENKDEYPPLSSEPKKLMFDNSAAAGAIFPEFFDGRDVLLCPFDEEDAQRQGVCDDHSYFYLGYALTSDAEVAAFAEVYRTRIAGRGSFTVDLSAPEGLGTAGGNRFVRLSGEPLPSAVTKALGPDWRSRIPVIIERPENHGGTGGHVAYLDGGFEWIPYPGKWPMTKATVEALTALAD